MRQKEIHQELLQSQTGLKPSQHCMELWNGLKLQYHVPTRSQTLALDLNDFIPSQFKDLPLEVEIGPGKGEFLRDRAKLFPERFFLGIDRRLDRAELSAKKMERGELKNSAIVREDACSFDPQKIPPLEVFHLYQPDPWPKKRHHKHRFFRSPEAKAFALALRPGGEMRLSTDHLAYFYEMIDIVKSWGNFELSMLIEKQHFMSPAKSHFENIFMKKKEPVFKAFFHRL